MVLLEVVEYVVECFLSLVFADEVLDIINDQGVDTLIEVDKFIDFAALHCGSVLAFEQTCSNIKYARAGIALLDADADGLNQVGFPYSAGTEHEERVECLELRIVCNSLTDRTGHFITVADAIVFKRIVRVELRVDILYYLFLERIRGGSGHRLDSLAGVCASD